MFGPNTSLLQHDNNKQGMSYIASCLACSIPIIMLSQLIFHRHVARRHPVRCNPQKIATHKMLLRTLSQLEASPRWHSMRPVRRFGWSGALPPPEYSKLFFFSLSILGEANDAVILDGVVNKSLGGGSSAGGTRQTSVSSTGAQLVGGVRAATAGSKSEKPLLTLILSKGTNFGGGFYCADGVFSGSSS